MRRRAPGLALAAAALVPGLILSLPGAAEAQESREGPTTILLVRHAEKVEDGSHDPPLTAAGEARALALAHLLASVELAGIHSTATRRTLATAEPVRRAHGLEIRRYDADALEVLLGELLSTPGNHVVVGHSNTTPALVRLLGGDPGPPIGETWEYDRLYVHTRPPDGEPTTILLRYGEPSRR